MAMTFQVKSAVYSRNSVQVWRVKKPWPPGVVSGQMFPPWKTAGWKIGEMARNVRGIIEARPSTVAKTVPSRIPRYDGTKRNRHTMVPMTSEKTGIGTAPAMNLIVWVMLTLNSVARMPPMRMLLTAMTGHQPSQYIHEVTPLMIGELLGKRSLNAK